MRSRSRKTPVGVSLFPFLAVLICTMGALIVLLVMVVQQARVHAAAIAEQRQAETAAEQQQLRIEQEDEQWRREILEQQRVELTRQQAEKRLELSHLEDHIRRLTERWKQLEQQAERLQHIGDVRQQDRLTAEDELQRVRADLQVAQQQLEQLRAEAQQARQSYALIPYKGANGTKRRPIYVECTVDGIILQPEGIVLGAEDFRGPLGPGNPLDAALRATREYLNQLDHSHSAGEPYPLLIVRPDGALSYATARAAMSTWDDEFGYELIDAEMQLRFPPPDPALAQLLERAVRDARHRQEILAAAMPSQFQEEAVETGFRATPRRGGFVRAGSGPGLGGGGGGVDASPTDRWNGAGEEGGEPGEATESPAGAVAARAGEKTGRGGPQGEGGAAPDSLAGTRGRDWGVPGAAAGMTGITRPIRVACLRDRLIVLPEQGDHRPPHTVPLEPSTAASIDQFVSAIWDHIDRWGIAVAGGYWKPVLHVEVAPDAERQFTDLQHLLQDSGIEVKRKSP